LYRPLPDCLTIGVSHIDGLGLIATKDILANIELGIGHIKDDRFENGWIRTPLGGFINHLENPNCHLVEVEDFLMLFTKSNIKAGDELTLHYTLYVPVIS